ncbi:MAG TPA: hypothetical protein VIM65_01250 [Cyclobacteriaceae bacterium]
MTTLHYPVTRKALARVYKISGPTLKIWLTDIGIVHNSTLSPADLHKIIDHYDLPGDVEIIV